MTVVGVVTGIRVRVVVISFVTGFVCVFVTGPAVDDVGVGTDVVSGRVDVVEGT